MHILYNMNGIRSSNGNGRTLGLDKRILAIRGLKVNNALTISVTH